MLSSQTPQVIDDELLRRATLEQIPSDVPEAIRKEAGEPSETAALRLDYKSIYRIDNLWAYKNLSKLQLDNNLISKIENLEHIINLTWLDLSFNQIKKIEGLEKLTKLQDLTLFNNQISKIENIEHLTELNVLSIGNNRIESKSELDCLHKFDNLRILNLAGNPITKMPDYVRYIIARFNKIRYLDFRLIDTEQVIDANEVFKSELSENKHKLKLMMEKKEASQSHEQHRRELMGAHLDNIEDLLDNLFNKNNDYNKVKLLDATALLSCQNDYEKVLQPLLDELKSCGMRNHQARRDEIASHEHCVKSASEASDSEQRGNIKAFLKAKKRLLRALREQSAEQLSDEIQHVKTDLKTLSDRLMSAEMILMEQFEDVLKDFDRNFSELSRIATEQASNILGRIREADDHYQERLNDTATVSYEKLVRNENVDLASLPDELRELLAEKDILVNTVTASGEYRQTRLDELESTLLQGLAKEQDAVARAKEVEVQRHWDRVAEIAMLIEKSTVEIDEARAASE